MNAVRLARLWKEKDENGNTYLSGKLNEISAILVMPNTDKKECDEPDYLLYLCQTERGGAGTRETEKPRKRPKKSF